MVEIPHLQENFNDMVLRTDDGPFPLDGGRSGWGCKVGACACSNSVDSPAPQSGRPQVLGEKIPDERTVAERHVVADVIAAFE
jgi:hypothetical protein